MAIMLFILIICETMYDPTKVLMIYAYKYELYLKVKRKNYSPAHCNVDTIQLPLHKAVTVVFTVQLCSPVALVSFLFFICFVTSLQLVLVLK